MDQVLVLYRTEAGRAVALDDRCAHRGTSLAAGWVEEGCVRCPYHGWRYASDGACIEIPANQPGVPIPRQARVTSYPVEERYGLVWVFLGDDRVYERVPIPPLPQYDAPGWRTVRGEFTWGGHISRVIANTVDMSHAPFVHATAFGRRSEPRIPTYRIEAEQWSGSGTITFRTKPAYFLKLVLGNAPPNGSITATFFLPNATQVYHRFGNVEFVLFMVHVPLDDRTTRTHWLHVRNFVTHPWADGFMRRDVVRTLTQDDAVVRLQPPGAAPEEASEEAHATSDSLEVAYRRMCRQASRHDGEGLLV
jgi:phenylpropionate dioxygenase-like ring-hydroxylating dioxygenase large terminal subunit